MQNPAEDALQHQDDEYTMALLVFCLALGVVCPKRKTLRKSCVPLLESFVQSSPHDLHLSVAVFWDIVVRNRKLQAAAVRPCPNYM